MCTAMPTLPPAFPVCECLRAEGLKTLWKKDGWWRYATRVSRNSTLPLGFFTKREHIKWIQMRDLKALRLFAQAPGSVLQASIHMSFTRSRLQVLGLQWSLDRGPNGWEQPSSRGMRAWPASGSWAVEVLKESSPCRPWRGCFWVSWHVHTSKFKTAQPKIQICVHLHHHHHHHHHHPPSPPPPPPPHHHHHHHHPHPHPHHHHHHHHPHPHPHPHP